MQLSMLGRHWNLLQTCQNVRCRVPAKLGGTEFIVTERTLQKGSPLSGCSSTLFSPLRLSGNAAFNVAGCSVFVPGFVLGFPGCSSTLFSPLRLSNNDALNTAGCNVFVADFIVGLPGCSSPCPPSGNDPLNSVSCSGFRHRQLRP